MTVMAVGTRLGASEAMVPRYRIRLSAATLAMLGFASPSGGANENLHHMFLLEGWALEWRFETVATEENAKAKPEGHLVWVLVSLKSDSRMRYGWGRPLKLSGMTRWA